MSQDIKTDEPTAVKQVEKRKSIRVLGRTFKLKPYGYSFINVDMGKSPTRIDMQKTEEEMEKLGYKKAFGLDIVNGHIHLEYRRKFYQ